MTTVSAATRATYAAFIGSGFAFASWAARIPQVRDELELGPSALGMVLLAIAAGSIVALVISGQLVARFGSRRTVAAMAVVLAAALVVVALFFGTGVPALVVGLFFFGFGNGAWDVAMNVQGAAVEQRLGRAIMPRFHAGWSVGTVAGALLGAGLVALDVSVTAHLLVVGLAVGAAVVFAVRWFLPDDAAHEAADDTAAERTASVLSFWREPRTLLIGVFVLAFAFAEGAGNDWVSVALIDDYGAPPAVGTLGFAVFLAAMTTGRWFGPALLDRFGRVPVLRVSAAVAVVGLALFVFGGTTPVAFAGALLWGVGTALGFPVGMSAAADDPARAAGRVSVVASIGYCAFLGGPPLVGFVADHSSVTRSLLAVAVLLGIAVLVADAVRPPKTGGAGQTGEVSPRTARTEPR